MNTIELTNDEMQYLYRKNRGEILMKIYGYSPFGYEGAVVEAEADLRRGIPAVDIVGLSDGSVKEARERMRAAIRNSGFEFPEERVLISLSPADLKKEGAGLDLAIALAVLCAHSQKDFGAESVLCHAELELSGALRPVRGTYAALESAAKAGIWNAIIPASISDAEIPHGIKVRRVETLKQAFDALTELDGNAPLEESAAVEDCVSFPVGEEDDTLDDTKVSAPLVRAMMIAAAGKHHLLAVGEPGCGKTLALNHFMELMPALTIEEAQVVTRIHSIAGLIPQGGKLVRVPPFRMPHQTASMEGMCGGGVYCRPGEISLAHHGVLFLDEAAEFKTSVLQMLRVPLESGTVSLSRAGRTTVYPAQFQLLLATNPCPCGFYGSNRKVCLCFAGSVEHYWQKFFAPLLDRVAIRIRVRDSDGIEKPTLAEMRGKIAAAVKAQRKRGAYNQNLSPAETLAFCTPTEEAKRLFDALGECSMREKVNALKVARTIADMDGTDRIEKEHAEEAIRLATWRLFPRPGM